MEIIAILNQKGGSAKKTTAVNLGSTLAEQNQKTLLIDLDPQGSASIWMGFKNPSKGLLTLFVENVSILDIISKTQIDGLDFVISSPWLISADKALASEVGAEMILKNNLYGLDKKYWDYVLIDCPPNLGIMSLNALTAANKVLVPIEPHIMAIQGIGSTFKHHNNCKRQTESIS